MRTRLRVLIADDHPGVVRAVSRLLAMNYDVVGSVADGSGERSSGAGTASGAA